MSFRIGMLLGIGWGLALIFVVALVFVLQPNDPDRAEYPVGGIDVSHHQGEIDWREVAASGVGFVFMKASEGQDFSDPRFPENWRATKEYGVPRGAYHFFTFCTSGAEQARHFLRVAPPEPDALPPAADIEFGGNCRSYDDLESVRRELAIFLADVEAAWGRKPVLYLTLRSMLQIADERFDGYPVWLRNVDWHLPGDAGSLWTVWQYSDQGEVPGIEGPVDLNVLGRDVSIASLRGTR